MPEVYWQSDLDNLWVHNLKALGKLDPRPSAISKIICIARTNQERGQQDQQQE